MDQTIEQHRDELIDRLGLAIKQINELERQLAECQRLKAKLMGRLYQDRS
jgi:hypothetical protein